MNGVARRDQPFRRELFEETANRRGLQAAIIEKDFWVCWTLRQLFSLPALEGRLIFKGGTTLSKVFGIIHRFSEDIDLTLGRALFGFGDDRNPDQAKSRNKREKLVKEMVAACRDYIQGPLVAVLRERFGTILAGEWELLVDPEAKDGQALLLRYPAAVAHLDYIQPVVRMEFGSRSDTWPTVTAGIAPYAAGEFAKAFAEPRCEVVALDVNRTFWEKATILHEEAHRPDDSPMPPRYSRHYYDLAMLANSPVRESALQKTDLLERVVWHKTTFFGRSWSHFDSAKPGTFRLVPPPGRQTTLGTDYQRMRQMIFDQPPAFADILAALQALEQTINGKQPLSA
jgi:hypothetical protein